MKEAQLYVKLENNKVVCQLCAHGCKIQNGKFGFCAVRQNINGILCTHNYGRLIAMNLDPVEKKPLYHFFPGSKAFSIACAGCNFRCGFCQNWQISQVNFTNQNPGKDIYAQDLVDLVKQSDCKTIAYTYTEPTIYFEFALEVMKLAKDSGLCNIFVSNGYMTKEAIFLLRPYLDAINIDLKFFKEGSYKKVCSARLKPVLDSIQLFAAAGVWIEITTLLIPGENDTKEELTGIAKFIAKLNKDIPWHISCFHPDYKFTSYLRTPERTLKLAYDLGRSEGLHYVYVGNLEGWGQDTICNQCKKVLIKRKGFKVIESHIFGNKCLFCQAILPGIYI